jgi:hypothetical protein
VIQTSDLNFMKQGFQLIELPLETLDKTYRLDKSSTIITLKKLWSYYVICLYNLYLQVKACAHSFKLR